MAASAVSVIWDLFIALSDNQFLYLADIKQQKHQMYQYDHHNSTCTSVLQTTNGIYAIIT